VPGSNNVAAFVTSVSDKRNIGRPGVAVEGGTASPTEQRRQRLSSLLVALGLAVFLGAGIVTLPHYGLTWDEALGDLFFGQRYFLYFTSLNSEYLDFERGDLAINPGPLNLYASSFRSVPWEVPPLAGTLSAMTMEIVGNRLGWLDPIDAFHLMGILLVAVLLLVLYRFAATHLGRLSALLAVLILASYPRFWGDMHNNPKDIPQAVFFSLTVMAFCAWYQWPSVRGALFTGMLGGAAMAVKLNALFIPPILVLGLWPWQLSWRPGALALQHLHRSFRHYLVMIVAAVGFYVGAWPYLYADPIGRTYRHVAYIFSQGHRRGGTAWSWDPVVQAVTTMPEAVLLLLCIGIALAILHLRRRSSQSPILRLLLIWAALPIVRASVPGAVNFDGIRHFVEFVPAVALLAGYGGASLIQVAGPHLTRGAIAALALLGVMVWNIGGGLIRYHPYEPLYYNSLVGGLAGARMKYGFPEATDYWASSYRHGAAWLNANAPEGAFLYVPVAPWVVTVAAPIWLRTDIRVIPRHDLVPRLSSGRAVYVMFITRRGWYDAIATYSERELKPVHQVVVDGLPVMKIYRLGVVSRLT
jgi:hypothetical protein